jgi:hypothetical protein
LLLTCVANGNYEAALTESFLKTDEELRAGEYTLHFGCLKTVAKTLLQTPTFSKTPRDVQLLSD